MHEATGDPDPTRLTSPRLWDALVALAAVALYVRTVSFGWAFDDQMEIVRNTYVHSFAYLPEIFRSTVWTGSGMETYLYRPLVLVTYALNHAVSGLAAWSYHLVNVVLHAGASVLVLRLGRLWGLPALAAGLGGLLFAVHPVHVEVVANVAGRKDLLAAVFVLGMVLCHRWAVARGGLHPALPVLLFACAMLTKEIGVMGLALVAAQDVYLEPRRGAFFNRPRVIATYFAYMGALVAFLLVRLAVTGGVGVPDTYVFDNPLVAEGALTRLATALAVVGKGMALQVAPLLQSPDYSFDAIPVVRSVADVRLLATVGGLGVLGWALTRMGVRHSFLPLAAAWYVLALLPASNLLVTVGTVFGERLLYLPSVAFCLAAGAGLAWLSRRRPRETLAGAVVILTLLSAQTVRYSAAWSGDIALFEWATRSVPGSTKAHHKLGEEYLRAGRLGDALRALHRALEIAPDNTFAAATQEATRRALVARFEDSDPFGPEADDPDVLAELGAARLQAGDTANALAYLGRAVEVDAELGAAWFDLARIHLGQGRTEAAGDALRSFLGASGRRVPQQEAWAREMLRRMGSR